MEGQNNKCYQTPYKMEFKCCMSKGTFVFHLLLNITGSGYIKSWLLILRMSLIGLNIYDFAGKSVGVCTMT